VSLFSRTWFLAASLLVPVSVVEAGQSYQQLLIDKALQQRLAFRPAWLALGHYRTDGDAWRSQADDAAFFLAPDGIDNPTAELKATLAAFFEPDTRLGDDHPQCRFPARLFWLTAQLNIDPERLPSVECRAFDDWYRQMQPAGVSIIFPAAYLNNPSSMFGHTFLRIDGRDQTDETRLLAYSLGYAASVTPGSNPVAYIYKGLFGGYPGTFTGAPYYDKVIEYGDIESRDIWEYELNLNQQETDQLVRHAWELQHKRFDYYFFDENCSYRLLTLLDVARPGLGLADGFDNHAIPVDTVRRIIDRNMVRDRHYRPAVVTRILDKLVAMPPSQQALSYALANGEQSPESAGVWSLSEAERVAVIDLAYEYSRYLAQKHPRRRKALAPVSMALLQARSRLPAAEAPAERTPLPPSPESGHETARLAFAVGQLERRDFQSFRLRPAFHDLLDSDPGYTTGAGINFLDFELRHYSDIAEPDTDDWQLEYLELVNIESLALRNRFFKPQSWNISAGWHRHHELPGDTLRFTLQGGWGATYGLRDRLLLYGLLGAGVRSRANLVEAYEGFATVTAGALLRMVGEGKLRVEARLYEYDGDNVSDGIRASFGFNQPVGRNAAVRFEYVHHSLSERRFKQVQFGWQRYF
jgi:hypothetical protein